MPATASQIPTEVVARYAAKRGIPVVESRALHERLEHFLDRGSRAKIAPEMDVDDAWHEFILDTKAYHSFCDERYGRFLHHVPSDAEHPVSPAAAKCESDCKCEAPPE